MLSLVAPRMVAGTKLLFSPQQKLDSKSSSRFLFLVREHIITRSQSKTRRKRS